MKAVAFVAPGKMEVREVPEPEPREGYVVVDVAYCGICGSDVHEYTAPGPSLRAAGMFQPIMGHEFTGVVARTGAGVDALKAGDPVVVHPGGACGNCFYCKRGESNVCSAQVGLGYVNPGGYAERVAVRADQALKLPDASWLEGAALTEPFGVGLRAVNRGALRAGESVLIAGGGPIGLFSTIAAARRGAGTIIVSEPTAPRRELALKLGAHQAIDPANSTPAQAQQLTGGLGCDVAIEAVGIPRTMDDCLMAVRRAGRVVVAGSFFEPYSINLLNVIMQEQTILGTFGYVDEFGEARDLIVSGEVDVSTLISAHVSLEQVPDTFAEIAGDRSKYQKVLVRPNG
jgi:(R,R)-butanediol dehydrogenase/meso-butanediol dehydrogenase/diacetyl reductase